MMLSNLHANLSLDRVKSSVVLPVVHHNQKDWMNQQLLQILTKMIRYVNQNLAVLVVHGFQEQSVSHHHHHHHAEIDYWQNDYSKYLETYISFLSPDFH
jgi:hypothetical protein